MTRTQLLADVNLVGLDTTWLSVTDHWLMVNCEISLTLKDNGTAHHIACNIKFSTGKRSCNASLSGYYERKITPRPVGKSDLHTPELCRELAT